MATVKSSLVGTLCWSASFRKQIWRTKRWTASFTRSSLCALSFIDPFNLSSCLKDIPDVIMSRLIWITLGTISFCIGGWFHVRRHFCSSTKRRLRPSLAEMHRLSRRIHETHSSESLEIDSKNIQAVATSAPQLSFSDNRSDKSPSLPKISEKCAYKFKAIDGTLEEDWLLL